MSQFDFLQTLKGGDKVILERHPYEYVRTVERVTATQVIVRVTDSYTEKFSRKDGYEIGASRWNRGFLREAKPEHVERIQAKELRDRRIAVIKNANLERLSDEQVGRIWQIISEEKAGAKS